MLRLSRALFGVGTAQDCRSPMPVVCLGMLILPCVALVLGCSGSSIPASRSVQSDMLPESGRAEFNTESYDEVKENRFVAAIDQPQSTFAIDVDTAAYSNIRRMLNDRQLPPRGAVRLEELVNYFPYSYPEPDDEHPMAVCIQAAACPWQAEHQLVRIAMKARSVELDQRASANLVFLIDVSGSMQADNKLPLVQRSLKLLVKELRSDDRVAIVLYAGSSGCALPSTAVHDAPTIVAAIDEMRAGGSTNGAAGIELAYEIAQKNFVTDGINRVILCTDGDFNVGITSRSGLIDLITAKARQDIFLTVLGFGIGNLKDSTMERLADLGNGNYAYIDSLLEARKVLAQQLGSTINTLAKDVKIQVDFNPLLVGSYRLLGYENRVMANEDFRDDKRDAGELGAGHTVTAFYEVVPASLAKSSDVRKSEFITTQAKQDHETMLTVNVRYKLPEGSVAKEFQRRLAASHDSQVDDDFQFATAVLGYGMLLRESEYRGGITWDWVEETARSHPGQDRLGLRAEFVSLARAARKLQALAVDK